MMKENQIIHYVPSLCKERDHSLWKGSIGNVSEQILLAVLSNTFQHELRSSQTQQ
jgi:hypothetical protein